ncbi:hypothetical protein H2199_002722 [Coniosporium tulheliwenetii]|uniref:Uncharacterized protein n=1 Tax=Coniosporium tulheliwenetii TaxID=3383036 RepID=A0ACC2ZD38_9PEZI|nr:hypothetical protein H2199_002722 [Cladosporium sp. JES 115]
MRLSATLVGLTSALTALACDSCYGPHEDVVMTRRVRRMQPEAQNATTGPRAPLEWGQINFLHADWGDYVSFTTRMKQKARELGVDLLLVDCGDMHDGAGLADATKPNGLLSNPVFENVDYDILAIGNHELYVSEIAYQHYTEFAGAYGERYLTSNVEILNPDTNEYEVLGLRIMAFGVLYNFTGNSNVSRITPASQMVKQPWFLEAVNFTEPIDLFILAGHNPARRNIFGGHNHIRDFAVYDEMTTALGSGRYCETLGWVSMTGINSSSYHGNMLPGGVPHPTRRAIINATSTASAGLSTYTALSSMRYARRYLDWNRLTFAYHASGSQDRTFDTQHGIAVSHTIYGIRQQLNLTRLYGCAPRTYCQFCAPYGSPGSIYGLIETALAAVVVNESRSDVPRILLANTGGIRFDVVQGPFTYDDSFIVIPFLNKFLYIPEVPLSWLRCSDHTKILTTVQQVLGILNAGRFIKHKKRNLDSRDLGFSSMSLVDRDICVDPPIHRDHVQARSITAGRVIRRQSTDIVPGYVTRDDFGTDGDDTIHSPIPNYPRPNVVQGNGSFPKDGSTPETVDLVFYDFIESYVLDALVRAGGNYTDSDVALYMPEDFTSNSYLPAYAMQFWRFNGSCPVGGGVGFDTSTKR